MALIGTISGSVGAGNVLTSNNAITGTLVIANTTTDFPTIMSDAVLFVSGNIGGNSKAVFGGDVVTSGSLTVTGDITGSNLRLTGDIAVVGGDLTTTVTTFNLINDTATTLNVGGAATTITAGAAGGSTTFNGNITGSNMLLSGDLAVNGGDITTTASTFNLLTNLATALNIGGTTPGITIGTSTGQTTVNIATGGATVGSAATPKTVNIGGNTSGTAAVFVNIGSTTARAGNARITLHNEVHLTSGTLVGSPGGVNNELTLVSSGSTIIKLDTNNDGAGHRFEIRDWTNGTQFAVSETGDAEITGNLLITGSSLSTQTTTTFNLLNTALTGTLNVSALASTINFGGSTTTSSFSGDIAIVGRTNVATVVERLVNSNGGTGTVAFDLSSQGIFYVNNPAGNITANFTGVPTTNNRVLTPTIILSQSSTARIVSAVQIDTAAQTINWANNVIPTGNVGKQDVFGFSLIRSGSAWKVLGQMSTYG